MPKKALISSLFLFSSLVNAHIIHFAQFLNANGQTIWLAGDEHESKKPSNQVNDKQLKQLLKFAQQKKAFVLTEDNNEFHHDMIKELMPKKPWYIHFFNLYDPVIIKEKGLEAILESTKLKKTSALHYSSLLFRMNDIQTKNIEWRYEPDCFASISPQQFFKAEEHVKFLLKERAKHSAVGKLIKNGLEAYQKDQEKNYKTWFEKLMEYDTLEEAIENNPYVDADKKVFGTEESKKVLHYRALFDLKLLHEVDQLKKEKNILIMAGADHTLQLADWLEELGYTSIVEINNYRELCDENDAINLEDYLPKESIFKRFAKKALSAIPFAFGLGMTIKSYMQKKVNFLPLLCGAALSTTIYTAFHQE